MFIVREIFTLDNLLHSILGFALMGIMRAISQDASLRNYAMFAAVFLFLREVGQVQAKYHDNNFLKGWSLRGSNPEKAFHRHMEWVVPAAVINGVTIVAVN